MVKSIRDEAGESVSLGVEGVIVSSDLRSAEDISILVDVDSVGSSDSGDVGLDDDTIGGHSEGNESSDAGVGTSDGGEGAGSVGDGVVVVESSVSLGGGVGDTNNAISLSSSSAGSAYTVVSGGVDDNGSSDDGESTGQGKEIQGLAFGDGAISVDGPVTHISELSRDDSRACVGDSGRVVVSSDVVSILGLGVADITVSVDVDSNKHGGISGNTSGGEIDLNLAIGGGCEGGSSSDSASRVSGDKAADTNLSLGSS